MRHEEIGSRSTMAQNKPINRHSLLSKAAKLFCKECQKLQVVTDFFTGAKVNQVALDCGHRRGLSAEDSDAQAA
jgi:hypothetical protein